MFVVPVPGDKIRTKDDGEIKKVSSYTSLKDEPAVYVKPAGTSSYVYFSDIIEINGVKVEYSPDSKVFDALGPLKRRFNIPQPKDTINIRVINASFNTDTEDLEVTNIRLHSKRYGEGRGLLIITKEGSFSLGDIHDIKRQGWSERFDVQAFKKFYFDYLPIAVKRSN